MSFAQPLVLLAMLLLPLIAVAAVVAAEARRKRWGKLVAERLSSNLIRSKNPLPQWLSLIFLLLACLMFLFALARPQGAGITRVEKSQGHNVLIALDLSRSMKVADVAPDRLAQAKLIIYELLDAMPEERIGLIGFAGEASMYAPLTVDHGGLRETVEQVDETWPAIGGSDLAAAVDLAIETFHETGQKQNALVILSDGEKHNGDTQNMIRKARESGVYILAIGVGTDDGDYVPHPEFPSQRMLDTDGTPVISRLQADVLSRLATGTGGNFARADSSTHISAMVKDAVSRMQAHEMKGREQLIREEFYAWFTLPGILLLIAAMITGTRWRALGLNLAVPLALLLAMCGQSSAGEADDALKAFQAGQYPLAGNLFDQAARSTWFPQRRATLRLAEGTAWYRQQDFERASAAFSEALREGNDRTRARAHSGMGNTLFELGWRQLSEEPYVSGSKGKPEMATFDGLVEDVLASRNAPQSEKKDEATARIEALITRWTDAVRHYDSALALDKEDAAARNNRGVTIAYLKRLAELLAKDAEQSEDQLSQMLPKPESAENPQNGNQDQPKQDPQQQGSQGQSKNPQDPQPSGDPQQQQNQDPSGQKPGDPPPGQKPGGKNPQDPQDGDPSAGDGKHSEKPGKPGEESVEQALKMLKENADVETGPMTPGRIRFRKPEKDW